MSRFWHKKVDSADVQAIYPEVTLIVPFRNEAENALNLSLNLKKLSYPNLEILLIDDHSEDASFQLLEQYFLEERNVQILKIPTNGKKASIEYGVNLAVGEIILCTDMDCSFKESWIEEMVYPFQDPQVQLVAGAVLVEVKNTFLEVFQSLDWASILLVTNYFFAKKEPLICSGANLSYRKSAFEQVDGYEGNRQIASGDDEFLLKKIAGMYGRDACVYLNSSQILVTTRAEQTWQSLINQRVRWASKWKAHFSISHALSAAGGFLAQLIWLGSFYLISSGVKGVLALGLVWLLKIAAEKLSLGKVLKSFGRFSSPYSFLQTSFVHPFYVLRVGWGVFRGKFTWKGRRN
ncbi:glycosyltransferase [Algoriphagus ratkowskyi]|nr:glycosyltransferase [Algoriphagus ratkowskyi]